MDEQDFERNLGISRRTLMKRTAVVGAGVAWATPVVQSLAKPALAQTRGTPSCTFDVIFEVFPGVCFKVGTATAPVECCECLAGGIPPPNCDLQCQGTSFTPLPGGPVPVPCP
jgi:hypothetical protein